MGRPQAGGKAAVGGAQPRQNRLEDDLPAAGTGLLQGAAGAGPAAEDRRSGRQSALAPPHIPVPAQIQSCLLAAGKGFEGPADQLIHSQGILHGGDNGGGIGLAVAQRHQRTDGLAFSGIVDGFRHGGNGTDLITKRHADVLIAHLIPQLQDDALGQLGADALGAGEGLGIPGGNGEHQPVGGGIREDGQGHPGAHPGNADEHPEAAALLLGGKAEQLHAVLLDPQVGQQGDLLPTAGQTGKGVGGGGALVADAAGFHHAVGGGHLAQQPGNAVNHVFFSL